MSFPSAALPAEAAAGLSTRWAVLQRQEGVYTDSAAKVVIAPRTGDFLATWCEGDVAFLHLSSGSLLGKVPAGNELEDDEDQFSSFDVDPAEQHLATISRRSMQIKVWPLSALGEGEEAQRPAAQWKSAHQLPVLDLAYSPTGHELASCSADKSIVVYSVGRAGVVTHRFAQSAANPKQKPGHTTRVARIFWHPNPKRAELISCAEDGEMRVWKLSDSSSVLLSNHMSQVTSVAFSKDGNTLISGGRDKVVNLWSLDPKSYGTHLRTLPVYESVEGLVVLSAPPQGVVVKGKKEEADDTYFTTAGSKGVLRTWSMRSLQLLHSKELPRGALASSTAGAHA